MSNIQQPEMRRSGHDPLVTDSKQERAQGSLPKGSSATPGSRSKRGKDNRPAGQRSRYGPESPEEGQAAQGRAPDEGRNPSGRTRTNPGRRPS